MATTKFEKPMGTEVETLKNQKINKSDIVNNLTTNDETKPLSAAQGYALNSKIAPLDGVYGGYITYDGYFYAVVIPISKNILADYNVVPTGNINIVGVASASISRYAVWADHALEVTSDSITSANVGKYALVSLVFTPK